MSLLVELAPTANASLTFSSASARKLADLNIEVEFQFVGDWVGRTIVLSRCSSKVTGSVQRPV